MSRGVDAVRDLALHIAFADARVAEHRTFVSLVDEGLGGLVIADAGDTDSDDLESSHLGPRLIQCVVHVSGQGACLGGHEGDPLSVRGHLVQGCLESLKELCAVLVRNVLVFDLGGVLRNDFTVEQQRVGDPDGIVSVGAEEQFRVVEGIKVLDRVRGAELDSLDLLGVDEEDLLRGRRSSAVFDTSEHFLQGVAELSVEQGRSRGVLHFVVALFSCIVHDLAAIHQQHELVRIDMDLGTVADDIGAALRVGAFAGSYRNTAGEHGASAHVVRLKNLEPLVPETASDRANRRFNKSHNLFPP